MLSIPSDLLGYGMYFSLARSVGGRHSPVQVGCKGNL